MDVIIMGRQLGQAEGFDLITDDALYFYQFIANQEFLNACDDHFPNDGSTDMQIDLESGILELLDGEDSKQIVAVDAVPILMKMAPIKIVTFEPEDNSDDED